MMFQVWQRMSALFALGMALTFFAFSAQAQDAAVPVPKASELARADRRPAKTASKGSGMSTEKRASKPFSYNYLLPFGVGQFEQNKTILGTALATTQAGFIP